MPSFNPLYSKPGKLCDLLRNGRSGLVQVVGLHFHKSLVVSVSCFQSPTLSGVWCPNRHWKLHGEGGIVRQCKGSQGPKDPASLLSLELQLAPASHHTREASHSRHFSPAAIRLQPLERAGYLQQFMAGLQWRLFQENGYWWFCGCWVNGVIYYTEMTTGINV